MGAGMPALGLSAAAVLVFMKGLVVRCDPRLPSHPMGIKCDQNRSIVDILDI